MLLSQTTLLAILPLLAPVIASVTPLHPPSPSINDPAGLVYTIPMRDVKSRTSSQSLQERHEHQSRYHHSDRPALPDNRKDVPAFLEDLGRTPDRGWTVDEGTEGDDRNGRYRDDDQYLDLGLGVDLKKRSGSDKRRIGTVEEYTYGRRRPIDQSRLDARSNVQSLTDDVMNKVLDDGDLGVKADQEAIHVGVTGLEIAKRNKVKRRIAVGQDGKFGRALTDEMVSEDEDETGEDQSGSEERPTSTSSDSQAPAEVEPPMFKRRQATRDQVVARQRWRARDGGAATPATSDAAMMCAGLVGHKFKLSRDPSSDGNRLEVDTDSEDPTAYIDYGHGTTFVIQADCSLCARGKHGNDYCANIEGSRVRELLYFNEPTDIAEEGYTPASCHLNGGILGCKVVNKQGETLDTLCLLGGSTLLIREGNCKGKQGETALTIIATAE